MAKKKYKVRKGLIVAPIKAVVEALDAVSDGSDKWIAHCPNHEDENPSLALWAAAIEGATTYNCFACGSDKAVGDAIALCLSGEAPRLSASGHQLKTTTEKQTVATYNYYYLDGRWAHGTSRREWLEYGARKKSMPQTLSSEAAAKKSVGQPWRSLYKIADVQSAKEGTIVLFVEGEKDVETANSLGFVATTCGGANDWARVEGAVKAVLQERSDYLVVIPDNDAPGRVLAAQVADSCPGARILDLPGLSTKGDLTDWVSAGGTAAELGLLISKAPVLPVVTVSPPEKQPLCPREQIVNLLSAREDLSWWVDSQGTSYCTDHSMTPPIHLPLSGSKGTVKQLLRYVRAAGIKVGSAPVEDALDCLAADLAKETKRTFVRYGIEGDDTVVATAGGLIRITTAGWSPTETTNIKLLSPGKRRPIPAPTRGGSLEDLYKIANVPAEDRLLFEAWLVHALVTDNGFPILLILGGEGRGKSWIIRLVQALLEPRSHPQKLPKVDWLMQHASKVALVAADNETKISEDASDILASIATGGELEERELYTNCDTVLYEAARPIILGSIHRIAKKADLLSRSITISPAAIASGSRESEDQQKRRLQALVPGILGALFDQVAAVKTTINSFTSPPLDVRFAGFLRTGIALQLARGRDPNEFINDYLRKETESKGVAIEENPLAQALDDLLEENEGRVELSPTALLEELRKKVQSAGASRWWIDHGPTDRKLRTRLVEFERSLNVTVAENRTKSARKLLVTRTENIVTHRHHIVTNIVTPNPVESIEESGRVTMMTMFPTFLERKKVENLDPPSLGLATNGAAAESDLEIRIPPLPDTVPVSSPSSPGAVFNGKGSKNGQLSGDDMGDDVVTMGDDVLRPIFVDFETVCALDLRRVGGRVYCNDPTFQALCAAFVLPNGDVVSVRDCKEANIPPEVLDFLAAGHPVCAHNWYGFDRHVWIRLGWGDPPAIDTREHVGIQSLPASLDGLARHLLGEKKDLEGSRLLKKLNKQVARGEALCIDDPLRDRINSYCISDVRQLAACWDAALSQFESFTAEIRNMHRRLNDRGFPVDRAFSASLARLSVEYKDQVIADSGLSRKQLQSTQQLRLGLALGGFYFPDLRSETVRAFLDQPAKTAGQEAAQRILSARLIVSQRAMDKAQSFVDRSSLDGREHDSLVLHGAHTGRHTGTGSQPQNLKRGQAAPEVVAAVESGDLNRLRDVAASLNLTVEQALSTSVRACIAAPPGRVLLTADLASIEARLLCWDAGQEDALTAFREGKDLYKVMASVLFRVPEEQVTKEQRQLGKTLILGCGYGMGANKFRDHAAANGVSWSSCPVTPEQAVAAYRGQYHRIPWLWGFLGDTAVECVRQGRGSVAGWYLDDGVLIMSLSSGRRLVYRGVRLERDQFDRDCWSYESARFASVKRKQQWGGAIAENRIQALAADLILDMAVRLDVAGVPPVLLVHDEIVCEVPEERADEAVEVMRSIMTSPPSWCSDLPLAIDGPHATKRFGK